MPVSFSYWKEEETTATESATLADKKRRMYMEDRAISFSLPEPGHSGFMVLDGHGGARTAEFGRIRLPEILREEYLQNQPWSEDKMSQILERTFFRVERELYLEYQRLRSLVTPEVEEEEDTEEDEYAEKDAENDEFGSGATCTLCVVTPEHFWTANVGDSGILVGDETEQTLCFVTVAHDPRLASEQKRIYSNEGCFIGFGRVNGNLALSRALGDFAEDSHYKMPTSADEDIFAREWTTWPVIALPDIEKIERRADHTYRICLASDGLLERVRKSKDPYACLFCDKDPEDLLELQTSKGFEQTKQEEFEENETVMLCRLWLGYADGVFDNTTVIAVRVGNRNQF